MSTPTANSDDPSELVRVLVTSGALKGQELVFWQAVEIARALDSCASTFSLAVGRGKLQESGRSSLDLAPGNGVEVSIGTDLVITGVVDKIRRSRTASEHAVNIQGRSVAGDLVDCSAMNSPGQWQSARLSAIASALTTPFSVPVSVEGAVDRVIRNFELEQGETVHDALERLARQAGAIVHDTPTGVVRIAHPGEARATTRLLHVDGPDGKPDARNNVLESESDVDGSKRFSLILVKGQTEGGKKAAGASGSATDSGVGRYRPKIISPPGQATAAECRLLAEWEVARRAGQAIKLTHTVKGWRQGQGGPLWDIDQVAPVEDDNAELYRDMLVASVRWSLDREGRRAVLTLEPPEAWTPQPFIDDHADGSSSGKWASVAKAVRGK